MFAAAYQLTKLYLMLTARTELSYADLTPYIINPLNTLTPVNYVTTLLH